jgi:acyl-coenzyme A thioesterase PaaI-like protein
MNKDLNELLNLSDVRLEAPPFLKILGFKGASIDEDHTSFVCKFLPSIELTHSNGTIVQGGFVAGMLDATMAQFMIVMSQGQRMPLTLDMTITYLLPCVPNQDIEVISTIIKNGRSIVFSEAKLYQSNKLVALSSAINKMVDMN